MSSEFRKEHWDKVWSGSHESEKSWFQETPHLSLALIERSGVSPADPVIDIGGGASHLVDHLLDRGYTDLTVLDLSGAALERTRRRLGGRAEAVNWIVADVTGFQPQRQYALWHDRAAFHFLVDRQDRREYVRVLDKALAPDGQAVISTFALDGPEKCSGLEIVRYDSAGLLAETGPGWCIAEEARESHITPNGAEQRFCFYRLRWEPALKVESG